MKLLADKICGCKGVVSQLVKGVSRKLQRPAQNHAPSSVPQPMLDRFVFDVLEGEALFGLAISLSGNHDAPKLKLPLSEFWLEMHLKGIKVGYFVDHHCNPDLNNSTYTRVVCFSSKGKQAPAYCSAFYIMEDGSIDRNTFHLPDGSQNATQYDEWCKFAIIASHLFEAAITSITSASRMAVTRVTHPYEDHKSLKKIITRNAQRGFPVYSMNKVEFKFLRNSSQKGNSGIKGHGYPTKGHWVIGHWRFVDAVTLEPYWTWVKPHERGNKAFGVIAKERHVKGVSETRIGVPEFTGVTGQHVAANHVGASI